MPSPRREFLKSAAVVGATSVTVAPLFAMHDFIRGLRGAGVSEKDIDTVSRKVAAGLLGLD